jgi:hypothetical protein
MYVLKKNGWGKENKIKVLHNIFVGAIDDINEINKNFNEGLRKRRVNEKLDTIEHDNNMNNFQLGRVQNSMLDSKNKDILKSNFIKTGGKLI